MVLLNSQLHWSMNLVDMLVVVTVCETLNLLMVSDDQWPKITSMFSVFHYNISFIFNVI